MKDGILVGVNDDGENFVGAPEGIEVIYHVRTRIFCLRVNI